MLNRTRPNEVPETKRKLVDAGINLMRARGYSATTVDDICAAAGVTKGGFARCRHNSGLVEASTPPRLARRAWAITSPEPNPANLMALRSRRSPTLFAQERVRVAR